MTRPVSSSDSHLVVIGGGIVGLATAMAISDRQPGVRITVLEKETAVAQHQTGHNSGVIHSGLYYAPGSLKARLAVSGAARMVEFCRQHGIAHELCGKVVVATDENELPRLQTLYERGMANGLAGLALIGPERLREIEPAAAGIRALYVPSTGIVDFVAVAEKLAELLRARGAEVRAGCRFLAASREAAQWRIETSTDVLTADFLVNCAGLHCDRVARAAAAAPSARIVPFRGEYYRLRPASETLVRTLIYPVPDPAFPFLGVHFTRMIRGGVEAGPNAVLALGREGYARTSFHPGDAFEIACTPGFWKFAARHWRTGLGEQVRSWSKAAFTRALQRLVPAISAEDLDPGGAGVRAQAMDATGQLLSDFHIDEVPGALHVLNAPSPAATASLAIGGFIADRVSVAILSA